MAAAISRTQPRLAGPARMALLAVYLSVAFSRTWQCADCERNVVGTSPPKIRLQTRSPLGISLWHFRNFAPAFWTASYGLLLWGRARQLRPSLARAPTIGERASRGESSSDGIREVGLSSFEAPPFGWF